MRYWFKEEGKEWQDFALKILKSLGIFETVYKHKKL